MYDVFLICPVRNASELQKSQMAKYIKSLEDKGLSVYYPIRDTNQKDRYGFKICSDNKKAMENSKEIHLFWDKTSQGTLFDLGMAFYSGKDLILVNPKTLENTEGKSFSNMIAIWAKYEEKEHV
jgi:hypothetical protein